MIDGFIHSRRIYSHNIPTKVVTDSTPWSPGLFPRLCGVGRNGQGQPEGTEPRPLRNGGSRSQEEGAAAWGRQVSPHHILLVLRLPPSLTMG